MPSGASFSFTFENLQAAKTAIIHPAFDKIIPVWLKFVATNILNDVKKHTSRFGSKNRVFSFTVSKISSLNHYATIFCTGPYVKATAFDIEFKVPVGGFQYGDINPLTGEPFPGGRDKHGTYITLEDKPVVEGEKPKAVSRTYSKRSGEIIKRKGFFSEALRKNFGEGTISSRESRNNISLLAKVLAEEIGINTTNIIVASAISQGFIATASRPIRFHYF